MGGWDVGTDLSHRDCGAIQFGVAWHVGCRGRRGTALGVSGRLPCLHVEPGKSRPPADHRIPGVGGGGLEKGARGPERSPHFILCHGESGLIQLEFEWMRLPNVGWWCQPPISERTLFMSPVSICDSVMALSFPVQKQLPGGAGSVLLGRGLGYRSCSFWKSIKVFRVISAAL